jgi:hypothetical protein
VRLYISSVLLPEINGLRTVTHISKAINRPNLMTSILRGIAGCRGLEPAQSINRNFRRDHTGRGAAQWQTLLSFTRTDFLSHSPACQVRKGPTASTDTTLPLGKSILAFNPTDGERECDASTVG